MCKTFSLLIDVGEDVYFNFSSLDNLERTTFAAFITFNKARKQTPIIKTSLMEELMNKIYSESCNNIIWIHGPPGSGKTTTLYWLYEQCKKLNTVYCVCVPVHHLDKKDYVSLLQSKIGATPQESRLLLFVDVTKPLQLNDVCVTHLEELFAATFCKDGKDLEAEFIIAVSSNFSLYLKTSPAATVLRDSCITTPVYKTKTFTENQSSLFVSTVNDSSLKQSILDVSKNIPKLLSLYREGLTLEDFVKIVNKCVEAEFDDVFKYIKDHAHEREVIESEAKLLWAVKAKLPYKLFGISSTCASQLSLVTSFLICIEKDVPEQYFPLSDEHIEFYTKKLLATLGRRLHTDNVNVINDYFENSIPSVILPKFQCVLRSKTGENRTIELKFNLLPQVLSSQLCSSMDIDTLYQTETYFKAVDYVARKKNVFGAGSADDEYLIAFQITAQKTNMQTKMVSSIQIPPTLTTDTKGVILILINPFCDNFQTNYDLFDRATNSSSEAVRTRFRNWWFGQPTDFQPVQALYVSIKGVMFES